MSYVTREQVSQALFNLINGVTDFQTSSRRLKQWDDIANVLKPAFYLTEQKESHTQNPSENTLTVRIIKYEAYIFVAETDPNAIPMTQLNNIIDLIDPSAGGVLKASPFTERQTLGGLVWHCTINGEIDKVPGDFDGQGVAIIPISVIIP